MSPSHPEGEAVLENTPEKKTTAPAEKKASGTTEKRAEEQYPKIILLLTVMQMKA